MILKILHPTKCSLRSFILRNAAYVELWRPTKCSLRDFSLRNAAYETNSLREINVLYVK